MLMCPSFPTLCMCTCTDILVGINNYELLMHLYTEHCAVSVWAEPPNMSFGFQIVGTLPTTKIWNVNTHSWADHLATQKNVHSISSFFLLSFWHLNDRRRRRSVDLSVDGWITHTHTGIHWHFVTLVKATNSTVTHTETRSNKLPALVWLVLHVVIDLLQMQRCFCLSFGAKMKTNVWK